MNERWDFLEGSYWYVPPAYLPALQMAATDTMPVRMTDQTVWQITGYSDGYFWGNCAALIYETGTTPAGAPVGMRMAGSVTPDGSVQISFMPISNVGAAMSTSGWGYMRLEDKTWIFDMQMASGITTLVAHWAQMAPTEEGMPSWEQLPGTDYSVPDFLAAAGF